MWRICLLLGGSLMLPLLVSCSSETNFDPSPAATESSASITETNAGIATSEATAIIDIISLVGTSDERLLTVSDTSLSCALAGYDGSGSVILQGRLRQPGDTMKITFNGCTLAGAPLAGSVKATLVKYNQDDRGERYTTRYLYQDFLIGSAANLISLNGDLTVESNYDYLTETSTTTRTSSSLELAQGQMIVTVTELRCVDAYTGLWDTAPFTTECQLRFDSAALGGSLSVVTVEPFRGVGGENRPSSGELRINGANSKARLIAQQDGEHVLLQWDQDNDDRYEGQLLRTWDELKRDMLDWSSLLTP